MFEVKVREPVASKGDNSWEGGGGGAIWCCLGEGHPSHPARERCKVQHRESQKPTRFHGFAHKKTPKKAAVKKHHM